MCTFFFLSSLSADRIEPVLFFRKKNHLPFFLLTLDDFYTSKVRYLPKVTNFPLLFVLLMMGVSLVFTHRAKKQNSYHHHRFFFGYLITAKKVSKETHHYRCQEDERLLNMYFFAVIKMIVLLKKAYILSSFCSLWKMNELMNEWRAHTWSF